MLNCTLNFLENNTEDLVLDETPVPQNDRTDTNSIAPLIMYLGGNRRWVPLKNINSSCTDCKMQGTYVSYQVIFTESMFTMR